jgi:hypothetical protein
MLNDIEIKQSKEKNTDKLLLEIETLKKEKEVWKSNSSFLLSLVEQLQNDNKLLHNKLQDKSEIEDMKKEYEEVAEDGFKSMEDMEKAYANLGYSYEADIASIN